MSVSTEVTRSSRQTVVNSYLTAREKVVRMGFGGEIDWQDSRCLSTLSESEFLREAAWVVLSTGMRESIIRRIFPEVSDAFLNWIGASVIKQNRGKCEKRALKAFNHRGKISAIGSICTIVADSGFERIREKIQKEGVIFLQTFEFIGPVTKYHLAKNIGLDVVKPDRHLMRLAKAARFSEPAELCQVIAQATGDKLAVVDLVLWRYATLYPRYTLLFEIED